MSYPAPAAHARPSVVTRALACDKLGVPAVLFFMLTGETPWARMTGPALSFLLLATIVALAVLHHATLLGVAPGSPAAGVLPAGYAVVAVIGLCWAVILRSRRPGIYTTIKVGATAVTAQAVPVPRAYS